MHYFLRRLGKDLAEGSLSQLDLVGQTSYVRKELKSILDMNGSQYQSFIFGCSKTQKLILEKAAKEFYASLSIKETNTPFKVGDLVRLKTGKSPIVVVDVFEIRGKWWITYRYKSSRSYAAYEPKRRPARDFILFNPKETEMEMLYETPDGDYGTKLAVNSKGEFVLEIKGNKGEVKAYHPSVLKEVVPYTVLIEGSDSTHHIQVEKGIFTRGEWLLDDHGNMLQVKEVDTKERRAKISTGLAFYRIATEKILLK